MLIRRVESKTNVVDRATRHHWDVMREVQAERVRPVMPRRVVGLWDYIWPVDDLFALMEVWYPKLLFMNHCVLVCDCCIAVACQISGTCWQVQRWAH